MHIIVYVTASSKTEAQKIAVAILEARLAACVNIIDGISSLFWWQAKIDSAQEALLVIKTRKALFPKLAEKIKSLHSYDVPEIIAVPIVEGDKKYLHWIDESTG